MPHLMQQSTPKTLRPRRNHVPLHDASGHADRKAPDDEAKRMWPCCFIPGHQGDPKGVMLNPRQRALCGIGVGETARDQSGRCGLLGVLPLTHVLSVLGHDRIILCGAEIRAGGAFFGRKTLSSPDQTGGEILSAVPTDFHALVDAIYQGTRAQQLNSETLRYVSVGAVAALNRHGSARPKGSMASRSRMAMA